MTVHHESVEFVGGPLDGEHCTAQTNLDGSRCYGYRQQIRDGDAVRVAIYLRQGEQMVFDGWESGMGDGPTLGEAVDG